MRRFTLFALIVTIACYPALTSVHTQPLELLGLCPLSSALSVQGIPDAVIVVGDSAAQEDWDAASEIADFIRFRLGGRAEILNASEVQPEDLRNRAVILIGGPVANKYAELPNERAPLRFVKVGKLWTVKTPDNRHFGGMYHFGFAQALTNPWNPQVPLLWVAGVDRYGTLGAAKGLLSYPCQDPRVGAVLFVTYDDGQVRVRDEFLAPSRPAAWVSPPMSALFLNAHSECYSSLVGVSGERVWMINSSYQGWLVPCNVPEDFYPIDSTYNAIYIGNSTGKAVEIYLGVYSTAGAYEASLELIPDDLLHWNRSWLAVNPGPMLVSLVADSDRIYVGDIVTIPWTGSGAAIKLNTVRLDGLAEFVFYKMPSELAFNWTIINLTTTNWFDAQLYLGTDSDPTRLRIEVLNYDLTHGWVELRVSVTLNLPANGALNLTDPAQVGDDLDLTGSVGLFLHFDGERLFLAKQGPISVPICEGLLGGPGTVDLTKLQACRVVKVGLYDSVVAFSP